MTRGLGPHRVERWLIVLIALHSLGVGVALLAFTDWSAAFGGWGQAEPRFFAQQGGVFHIVVALGYLLEYLRHRGVGLLVLAKSIAVVFLVSVTILGEAVTWVVPISALTDAMMAAAVLIVHRWASRRPD
jgi:hypothetical protein